jgi:hypothetical protein
MGVVYPLAPDESDQRLEYQPSSSVSRIAQARLLVLPTPVAEARAYAERRPRARAWCF